METKPKSKDRRACFHKAKSIIMKKTWFVTEEKETDIKDVYDFKPGKNVASSKTVLTKKGLRNRDVRECTACDKEVD